MSNQTLEELSAQLEIVQNTIERLRAGGERGGAALPRSTSNTHLRSNLEKALIIVQLRRARHRHFGNHEIFGEPSWDILLDLYIHHSRNEHVSVKSASIASGVPASTALRWLNALEDRGLISSKSDSFDQRRRLVRLTPLGHGLMTDYLHEASL